MPSVVNLFKLAALYQVAPHELYGELFKNIEGRATTLPTKTGEAV